MSKPMSVAIMFGAPSPYAREHDGHDEDSVEREQPVDSDNGPNGEFVCRILRSLRDNGPKAARDVMELAHHLEAMAHAAVDDDGEQLKEAAESAWSAADDVTGDGEGVGDDDHG